MSDLLRLCWAIARSGWRSTWNRSVRFSRFKTALIALAVQILFFAFIARRAPVTTTSSAANSLTGVFALMGLQMGWFGMMYGFARGQSQLYQGILVPLFQISPARPLAFLIGRVIEAVPTRAWSTLLWAWVYSRIVPGGGRIGLALVLATFGLAIGMIAHLSGLLLLAFWSRYSAKSMRGGLLFFGASTLALATWAVIFLSRGGTITEVSLLMREYRLVVFGALLLLAGIPGVLLLGTLILRPDAVEELYRRGLYNVIELGETDMTRPPKSLWLPLGDGVIRAVLSREWLQLSRSRITRVQLMIWFAGTVGVFFAGQSLAGQSTERVVLYVGALSLGTWFLSFGHWVIRVFEQERVTIALYRLTAVPTWKLLLAKFISIAVPSGLLVMTSALVGSVSARLGLGEAFAVMGWTAGALAAGVLGGFGMAAATANEEPEEPDVSGVPRREMDSTQSGSNAWWTVARTISLVLTMVLPIWTAAGQPGLTAVKIPALPLLSVDLLLPVVLLTFGSWLMIHNWETNG